VNAVALRVTACENEALAVSCGGQDLMRIINAHYGRLEKDICTSNIGEPNTACLFAGVRDVVYSRSATRFGCAAIFSGSFIANYRQCLAVKEFPKSVES